MLQTVKSLRAELQSVKIDNERILKAQEELNDVLLNKILDRAIDKTKGHISSIARTEKCKRKNPPIFQFGNRIYK